MALLEELNMTLYRQRQAPFAGVSFGNLVALRDYKSLFVSQKDHPNSSHSLGSSDTSSVHAQDSAPAELNAQKLGKNTPSLEQSHVKGIYAFDFDGTITTKDTFALFLRYNAGTAAWAGKIIALIPVFIAYKIRLVDRHAVKKAVIKRFFAGKSASEVNESAKRFAQDVIPPLLRPGALARLEALKQDPNCGLESLYICSASIDPYLKAWATSFGILENHVLATQLESKNGMITGAIDGYNVWGPNKVRRIEDALKPHKVNIIEAYGDTRGDREMLHAADASFFKPFRF